MSEIDMPAASRPTSIATLGTPVKIPLRKALLSG
jgi:hypothetical protein